MSILDRLEEIRIRERLNKGQFEKVIGKSSGYMGTLMKSKSIPGVDVIVKISENFPEYNINWLLTGQGNMLQKEVVQTTANEESGVYRTAIEELRAEINQNMGLIKSSLTSNFETINEALLILLKGDNKVQNFLNGMNDAQITETAKRLQEYLQEKQKQ